MLVYSAVISQCMYNTKRRAVFLRQLSFLFHFQHISLFDIKFNGILTLMFDLHTSVYIVNTS